MPEISWPVLVGSLVLFVVVGVFFARIIPRAMGKQCPKCLRRVPKGKTMCPACGATVNARTDLGK
jgi:rRNA maturation endonuclease Nob1